ncbi:hypothetical protein PQX77_020192 [Marasmius sp. AFHP31]|nr:hypothetical protein PQX77_020192 [Marasmius sp. AFHP31]
MSSETENMQQALEPFTSIQVVIIQLIATLSAMFLVYGMYVIIFGLSLNVLWRRRDSAASKVYTRWVIVLFVLTSIYNAANVWIYMSQTLVAFSTVKTGDYMPMLESLTGDSSTSVRTAQLGLSGFPSVIMGIIIDYLLVHRCYVIWGFKKRILYPFAFVVLVTDGIGFVGIAVMIAAYSRRDTPTYLRTFEMMQPLVIITAVYDSALTLMTAGRIWWITREAGQMAGRNIYTKYKVVVATILESGLLYSATLLISIIVPRFTDPGTNGLSPFDPEVISIQMAAIAPTLIIVRIAYGQTVESVQQMVSTLHFAEAMANGSQQRSVSAPAVHGTIDLRQSLAVVEERGSIGRDATEKSFINMEENVV